MGVKCWSWLAIEPSTTTFYHIKNTLTIYQSNNQRETLEIRNVWAENVESEMAIIRSLIETRPYVAMDTEFPGVVARPVSETYSPDFHYKSLKCNVDLLKIIQLGLTFADEDGNYAKGYESWFWFLLFDCPILSLLCTYSHAFSDYVDVPAGNSTLNST